MIFLFRSKCWNCRRRKQYSALPMQVVQQVEPDYDFREDCWPDCVKHGRVVVDDVSRLNATAVNRIFQVRSIEDVQAVLLDARNSGKRVSMRGAKHSMGGMGHNFLCLSL